jgi:hypothetical protein
VLPHVSFDALNEADLLIDSVYEGGRRGDISDDPLARLLPVGNQGGFRYAGPKRAPRLVVLYTTGREAEWPDELDEVSGTFTYYGDNHHPGRQLHDTQRGGNVMLRDVFASFRDSPSVRETLPVFLVFESTGGGRDIRFRGLAVPGSLMLDRDDEIAAIWRSENHQRFQNYRARFTVLDTPLVTRAWIRDVIAGQSLSANAPESWTRWVRSLRYQPLAAPPLTPIRSKVEQLPWDPAGWELLGSLYDRFRTQPARFEPVAARLATLAVSLPLDLEVTRPVVDGGRDATGLLRVGPSADPVAITLALEAKCYAPGQTAVGVKDISRLIARLRYRDVGFMVTTSYVARQAYQEVRHDRHPVVILPGGDLVKSLRGAGVRDARDLDQWLDAAA